MPNPADDVPTSIPIQITSPRKKLDSHDVIDFMRLLRERNVIRAKITAPVALYYDSYIADLYAMGGVGISGDLTDDFRTHQDIIIYNPNIYKAYSVGDKVYVIFLPSKVGIIVDGFDPGAGLKYQVYMTLDDNKTTGWDYPRMH